MYAVAIPGAPGKPAEVRLYDGNGDRFAGTVIPFPGYEGNVNVAMGDVDGDGILDLIVFSRGRSELSLTTVGSYTDKAKISNVERANSSSTSFLWASRCSVPAGVIRFWAANALDTSCEVSPRACRAC